MIEGASYRWPGRGVWGGVVVAALLWSHPAVAAPAPANQTFATYAVGAADPDALLEAAKAAAGPDATVSFDARQQRLLVLAPAAIQEQVAALVREAAPAPVNVRIEVQFRGQQRRQQSELSLGGGVGVIHEPGLTHTRVRVEPRIENQLTTESTDVRQVPAGSLTDDDAVAAGEANRAALLARLRHPPPDTAVWRVGLRYVGIDDRIERRAVDTLTDDDIAALRSRLERLDRGAGGPWTRTTLQLIEKYPGVVSTALARHTGQERPDFKINVRKLKEMGLTESLQVGYQLSPRGQALLRAIR